MATEESKMSEKISLIELQVLGARIAVKRAEKDTKTEGGILLPNTSGEKPMIGSVVSIGFGEKDKEGKIQPIEHIKIGDEVLFQKWGGTEIKTDAGDVVIMNVSDVLAVMQKGAK